MCKTKFAKKTFPGSERLDLARSSDRVRIDNSTKGSSLFVENHEVGELVVSVRQGLQETVVWAIAERDIPNRWNYQNLHLGRINGAFEVIVSATRFLLNFVGCQKGDRNDKT